MSNELVREYIRKIRERYQKATRRGKSAILNEFCEVAVLSRKHAIKIINQEDEAKKKKPGPKPKYGPELIPHLKKLYYSMEQINSKRMAAALPIWLPFYNPSDITEEIKNKLIAMSPSTIERLLKEAKAMRGISTTKTCKFFKNKIPLMPLDVEIKKPGFFQADTVAHCGNSAQGDFMNTLTMVDIFSTWTENRAVFTKESKKIRDKVSSIEASIPFDMVCFHSDCGTEFLNYTLMMYLENRSHPVTMKRSRPYKKNDNAYVEQKNYTHVRELFGYDRIDRPELETQMNEIYTNLWNPLNNFFLPNFKLKEKIRVGSKLIKRYEKPKTAYQRLLESSDISSWRKRMLTGTFKKLNPFQLKTKLEIMLRHFFIELKRLHEVEEVA